MLNRAAARVSHIASRHLLGLLIAALLVTAILYSVYDLCFAPSYAIGDWLINYSQGFVRRGLSGQFILLLGRALHLPLPWTAVLVQIPLYALFLYGAYKLAAPLRRDALWYALLLSPATLPFMILNPANGCRKEVLLFAALAAFILLLQRGRNAQRSPNSIALSLLLAALVAVMVLSHDALFCCLPFFFAAIALATRDLKLALKISAAPALLALALIDITAHHPGDLHTAIGICRSVGGRWIAVDDTRDLCAGAIRHISWTLAHSRREELQSLHDWPLFLLLALLSAAPFVVALARLRRQDHLRFESTVLASTAILCALLSVPLFYLTIDWGRWIHMQAICLLLVVLLAAQRAPSFHPQPHAQPTTAGKPWRAPLLIAVFLYCTCWTLPVYGGLSVRFGYLDVARFFRHEIPHLHRIDAWHTIDRGW
jgi:hypothetical protein